MPRIKNQAHKDTQVRTVERQSCDALVKDESLTESLPSRASAFTLTHQAVSNRKRLPRIMIFPAR
jgi:hypothetical protein